MSGYTRFFDTENGQNSSVPNTTDKDEQCYSINFIKEEKVSENGNRNNNRTSNEQFLGVEEQMGFDTKEQKQIKGFEDPAGNRYNTVSDLGKVAMYVHSFMYSLPFRILTMLLVLLDISLVAADIALNGTNLGVHITSIILSSYFVIEVSIRMMTQGRDFLKDTIEVLDAVVVMVAFSFTMVDVITDKSITKYAQFIAVGRCVRIILIFRILTQNKQLQRASRWAVSQNKRRYQKDGFDLDLCYVTNRVIAMSFPSSGWWYYYRNPIKEVARFFEEKHKGHYLIFNLCSEKGYDETLFNNAVERVEIDDHNVPKMEQIMHFVEIAKAHMLKDDENVIAIHCKGGKGRTGTMVCIWLIESGTFAEAEDSLNYFGARRTDKSIGNQFQGVETPSQSRYVKYFEIIKHQNNGQMFKPKPLFLDSIVIKGINDVGFGNGKDLKLRIRTQNQYVEFEFENDPRIQVEHSMKENLLTVNFVQKPELEADTKFNFFSKSKKVPVAYDDCAFFFTFHTSFIKDNVLVLGREELDNAHKKSTWNVYKEDFKVQLNFSDNVAESIS